MVVVCHSFRCFVNQERRVQQQQYGSRLQRRVCVPSSMTLLVSTLRCINISCFTLFFYQYHCNIVIHLCLFHFPPLMCTNYSSHSCIWVVNYRCVLCVVLLSGLLHVWPGHSLWSLHSYFALWCCLGPPHWHTHQAHVPRSGEWKMLFYQGKIVLCIQ